MTNKYRVERKRLDGPTVVYPWVVIDTTAELNREVAEYRTYDEARYASVTMDWNLRDYRSISFRVNEAPYKEARRALSKLRRLHADDFLNWALWSEADRSICPELYREPETQFGSTCNDLDDRLLITVADAYGLNPELLDDVLLQADWIEQYRQVGAAVGTQLKLSDMYRCTPEGAML